MKIFIQLFGGRGTGSGAFVEKMLSSNDEYAIDVVCMSFLEPLLSSKKLNYYVKFLGPQSKSIINQIGEKYYYSWKKM